MKRLFILTGSLMVCVLLSGCANESHEGLISGTINHIERAGGDVRNIKTELQKALDEFNKTGKFNLADTYKAIDQLKKTGDKTQELKRDIEQARNQVTEEKRKTYAEEHRGKLNKVFKDLLASKKELREVLDALDANPQLKQEKGPELKDLRKRIIEAEGPFEAQARQ